MSAGRVFWLVIVSVGTLALTYFLLTSGERGVAVATALAIPIAIVAIVVTVVLHRTPDPSTRSREWFAAGIGTVLLIGAALGIWWLVERYSDLDVDLGPPFMLDNTSDHVVDARIQSPPWRGDLVFTPNLANIGALGDCVEPAILHITPIIDGRKLTRLDTRHQEQVTIKVPDSSREVQLRIEYTSPGDPECRVEATLTSSSLRR